MLTPLLVTAHTPAGYASNDHWSPSLDGIIAFWQLREQLGEEEFALGMTGQRPLTPPDDLPLARESFGPDWWWLCSSPIRDLQAEYLHYYHRRFDALPAERFADTGRSGRVAVSSGPYKNYRIARTVHVAPAVSWHCIGDQAEITRLLRRCSAIGSGVGSGMGRVTRWTVTEDQADEALARYYRPLPAGYAEQQGIDGMRLQWGIKPPGRVRENRCLAVLPLP